MATKKKTKELNSKEVAVIRQCADAPSTIADIAKRFRRADNDTQRNSWARNSVRRPVRMGLIKKLARGTYGLTAKGKQLVKAVTP